MNYCSHSSVASSTTSPGVAARTLACIADVLGAMAGERAGLRSGPARNESWMQAFELLDVCAPLCCFVFSTRIMKVLINSYFVKANKDQANCVLIPSQFLFDFLDSILSKCSVIEKKNLL